jgi:hypothetical protein
VATVALNAKVLFEKVRRGYSHHFGSGKRSASCSINFILGG